jgi:predicted flap endonuclease-1-like 5' DNA nuclease
MDELSQWIKQQTRFGRRRGAIPWWAWALAAAGGLSVLLSWLLRRRMQQRAAEPEPAGTLTFPKVLVAANTPVEIMPPVVQDIPLPSRPAARSEKAGTDSPGSRSGPGIATLEQAGDRDDLTVIEGIGPVIAGVLQRAGITTHARLAETDSGRLEQILQAANIRIGDPASWPDQARLAAAGDWEGLKALQSQLKGGRRVS